MEDFSKLLRFIDRFETSKNKLDLFGELAMCEGGQGSLMVRVLGSCHSVPGSIPAWEFDLMGMLI